MTNKALTLAGGCTSEIEGMLFGETILIHWGNVILVNGIGGMSQAVI